MTFTCTRCGRLFQDATAGQGTCPFCGQPAGLGGSTGLCMVHGRDMRLVARRQRWLLWLVLAAVSTNLFTILAPAWAMSPFVGAVVLVAVFGLVVLLVVGVILLLSALRAHIAVIIVGALLSFAPCINLLVLMAVNMSATRVLRKAGLKVGFMGVPDAEVVRRLSPNLCRQCGYDLTGNVSGRCPECGTMIPRVVPLAVAM